MKYKRIVIIVAMVALMLPVFAYAQGPGGGERGSQVGKAGKGGGSGILGMPRGAWWQREQVVKQLSLTKQQQKKIGAIALSHRKEMITLRAELEIKEVDLDPLLTADKLDEKKIREVVGGIEATRAKLSKSRMNMLIEVRKVLTRDQYVKLKQYKGLTGKRAKRGSGQQGAGGRRPGGQSGQRRPPGGQGGAQGPMAGM